MSLSNPVKRNPSQRYFRWSGGAEEEKKGEWVGGKLTWYDKEAEEEKTVDFPFSFIVLDELNTIGGFSDADRSSYWANEVRNLKRDKLYVRTRDGVKADGLYENLTDVRSKGARYAKSVYIAFRDDNDELAIGNLKLMGAALTEWINFNKKYDTSKLAVSLEGADGPKTKGKTKYFVPVFKGQKISDEAMSAAVELDKELQEYLKGALNYQPTDNPEHSSGVASNRRNASDDDDDVEIEDLDEKPADEPEKGKADVADDEIDVKDVPF